VAIKVRLADWTTVTRARTLADATHDTALVTETALELLRAYAPPQPVRLLGMRLANFDDLEPDRPPAPVAPVGQLALPV
jgi:DNA polymerase-4